MKKTSAFMPMELEALVIDDLVGGGSSMRRWEFSYRRMDSLQTPEPDAMSNDKEIKERGIWLRWVLPRELRTEEEQGGFPLIPNRFLITRIAEETGEIRSLVLESDCPTSACMTDSDYDRIMPYTSQLLVGEEVRAAFQSSPDPYRKGAYLQEASAKGCYHVNLGIPFPLQNWQERDGSCMFLTACPPGNPNFTGYVQHNSNVLSYFDNLADTPPATFHYSVIGWYSREEERELFFSSQVFTVPWNRSGFPLADGSDCYRDELREVINSGKLHVAVGETCDAAFRAYLLWVLSLRQGVTGEKQEKLGLLLAALKEGCPDWLEEPSGLPLLRDAVHADKFQEKYGGARETEEFDSQVQILHSLQGELLDAWWKLKYLERHPDYKTGRKAKEFQTHFDISRKDSLLSRTVVQFEKVKALFESLRNVLGKENTGGRLLGRFWRMENPYVLVSGLEAPGDLAQEKTTSRSEAELIRDENHTLDLQGLEHLPGEVVSLLAESIILLNCVYHGQGTWKGTLPDYPIEAWRQPWKPAFMEWRVSYEALDVDGRDQESFYFDGYDYQLALDKKTAAGHSRGFGGISTLDGHKKLLFAAQLKELAEKTKKEELAKLADQAAGWKLLGQELVNLQDEMSQRDYRTFRRPYKEKVEGLPYLLDEVLGFWSEDQEFARQICGGVESVPLINANIIPAYRFMQGGRMHIDDLILYDGFGRVLSLIRSGEEQGLYQSKNFPLIVPKSMRAEKDTMDNGFLLKPGLLQYSRLSLSYLREEDNPVLGYVILNRLNHSLSLYSPEGEALGDLILAADLEGKRNVKFLPFRDAAEHKVPDSLRRFIQAQTEKAEVEFQAFLDVVDRAFWTMDGAGGNPDERVALTVGRPLALVRLEAYVDLYGLPRKDASWKGGGETVLEDVGFPMCLGSLSVEEDGVIGYFMDETFTVFYSAAEPERDMETVCYKKTGRNGTYIPIGFGMDRAATPFVLCDPLLGIHAYTGILPVKRIQLEKKIVLENLKRMEIYFRMGPLPIRLVKTEEKDWAVQMVKPALPGGVFGWLERTDGIPDSRLYTIQPSQGRQEGSPDMREGELVYQPDKKAD